MVRTALFTNPLLIMICCSGTVLWDCNRFMGEDVDEHKKKEIDAFIDRLSTSFDRVVLLEILHSNDYNVAKADEDLRRRLRNDETIFAAKKCTDVEAMLFDELLVEYGKNFSQIAKTMENKTVGECLIHYYGQLKVKKNENYIEIKQKLKGRFPHQWTRPTWLYGS